MAVSMASASATPSSSMRMASRPNSTPSREDAKPGRSCTTMPVFAIPRTQPLTVLTTPGSVRAATTTSTSLDAGTGLKKCIPRNRSGRRRAPARSVTDNELVLEATTASGPTADSAARSTAAFRSGCSGTASTTRPVSGASSLAESRTVSRARTTSRSSGSLPRRCASARPSSTRCRAARAGPSPASTTATDAPAARKTWAMPAPMRPPPITATRVGTPVGAVISHPLDQHGDALTHPDAQGGQSAATARAFQPAQQGDQQAGTRATQRVAERNRPTLGVHDLLIDLQPTQHTDRLGGERLVQLDRVQVVDAPARLVQRLAGRRHRAQSHDVRCDTGAGADHDPGPGVQPVPCHGITTGQHQGRGPVRQRRAVAGGDHTVGPEHRLERPQGLHRGTAARPLVGADLDGLLAGPHGDRGDLLLAPTRVLGGDGPLVAAQREGVALVAGQPVECGDLLGGLAHRQGELAGSWVLRVFHGLVVGGEGGVGEPPTQ